VVAGIGSTAVRSENAKVRELPVKTRTKWQAVGGGRLCVVTGQCRRAAATVVELYNYAVTRVYATKCASKVLGSLRGVQKASHELPKPAPGIVV